MKHFIVIISKVTKQAIVVETVTYFKPGLVFACMAGAFSSGGTFGNSTIRKAKLLVLPPDN